MDSYTIRAPAMHSAAYHTRDGIGRIFDRFVESDPAVGHRSRRRVDAGLPYVTFARPGTPYQHHPLRRVFTTAIEHAGGLAFSRKAVPLQACSLWSTARSPQYRHSTTCTAPDG